MLITIIKLSTYCVPGPKLRALPRLLTHNNTAAVKEVLSLFFGEGTEAEKSHRLFEATRLGDDRGRI